MGKGAYVSRGSVDSANRAKEGSHEGRVDDEEMGVGVAAAR